MIANTRRGAKRKNPARRVPAGNERVDVTAG